MFSEQNKIVFWVCDKMDCGMRNYRVIRLNELVVNDRCDHCKLKIHEPIIVDADDKQNNS
jgi:hypothetical protein